MECNWLVESQVVTYWKQLLSYRENESDVWCQSWKVFFPQEVLTCFLAISAAPFWAWSSWTSIYPLSGRGYQGAGSWQDDGLSHHALVAEHHSVLSSTGREFCTSQISMRFGSLDWGAPIQLVWAAEKEGTSTFWMTAWGGLMAIFCSRPKGFGNCSLATNIRDRQNSKAGFVIVNYVWPRDCWIVSHRTVSTCTAFAVPDIYLPQDLRTFLGRDHVNVQFLPLRLMHFLLMALLWWISPHMHALVAGVTPCWLWKNCEHWYVWRSQYDERRNYSRRIISGWGDYLPLLNGR